MVSVYNQVKFNQSMDRWMDEAKVKETFQLLFLLLLGSSGEVTRQKYEKCDGWLES
jgi:hypothetical protein